MKRTKESRDAMRIEALSRAASGLTMSNYPAIYEGFMARGIPESEIHPRENVFTYEAWRALGRHVRKGEHGVKVVTYVERPASKRESAAAAAASSDESQAKLVRFPKTTTVFHISQTDPDEPRPAVSVAAAVEVRA